MKIDRFMKAALLGLTVGMSPAVLLAPMTAQAESLRVVKKGRKLILMFR
jgi:pilus assembly protein CpaC